MPEFHPFVPWLLTILSIALAYYVLLLRLERDAARQDLAYEQLVAEALGNRVDTLRGDLGFLEADNKRLAAENLELQRENGRFAAEIRQLKQVKATAVKRDPQSGRFLPNPNAKRPRKSRAKTAPIACG